LEGWGKERGRGSYLPKDRLSSYKTEWFRKKLRLLQQEKALNQPRDECRVRDPTTSKRGICEGEMSKKEQKRKNEILGLKVMGGRNYGKTLQKKTSWGRGGPSKRGRKTERESTKEKERVQSKRSAKKKKKQPPGVAGNVLQLHGTYIKGRESHKNKKDFQVRVQGRNEKSWGEKMTSPRGWGKNPEKKKGFSIAVDLLGGGAPVKGSGEHKGILSEKRLSYIPQFQFTRPASLRKSGEKGRNLWVRKTVPP